ncbi:hypothetical protein GC173_09605 [bacterium]|nr:hypothetical protein [bacterium]
MTAPIDHENQGPPSPSWGLIALAAVVCVVLKLVFATQRGFWIDEYYTLSAVQMDLGALVRDRLERGHSPLPFLYAKLFHDYLGTSEWWLKLSSALAAGVATLGVGALLREFRVRFAGVVLVLAALQPYWQEIGTEFRYTMPLVALATWSGFLAIRWCATRDWRWASAFLAVATVMMWWHGSAQFVLLSLLVYTLLAARRTGEVGFARRAAVLATPVVAAFLLSLPLLGLISHYKIANEEKKPEWPSLRIAFENVTHTALGEDRGLESVVGPVGGALGLVATVCFVVAIWGAWRLLRRGDQGSVALRSYLLATLVGTPLGILVYTTVASAVQGPERYVAYLSVPGILVLGLGWSASEAWKPIMRRGWRWCLGVSYILLLIVNALDQGDWHRECSRWMAANRRADEPLITMGKGMNEVGLRYHGLRWEGFIDGVDSQSRDTSGMEQAIRDAMKSADSGWLFLYRPGRADLDAMLARLQAEGFLRGYRRRYFSREMSLVAIARTTAGLGRLAALDTVPAPWITSNPPRD